MSLIEIRDVKKTYTTGRETSVVLNGINQSIEKGEKVAIVGPSGSGKTTLLNIIGLLIQPTSGEVYINGRNVLSLSTDEKAKLRNQVFGYVFQDFVLMEKDHVLSNVMIPLLYAYPRIKKGDRKQMVEEALEKVGLSHKLKEKVKYLSGGERQRVAIARAIVNNPFIILADEPTGSLDVKNRDIVMDLFDTLVEQGKTLLIVTHNEEIAKRCDRVVQIKDGILTATSTFTPGPAF
ncbi:Uncharacterized ABC transporter ATP-binding protein YknY [[Clostridium] ultunense Esp]|nr:Uncharacterized ABC transporter ATP-binding protein YknY [[Clostridium] ultunense Esp]